jgi:hypothetical protein
MSSPENGLPRPVVANLSTLDELDASLDAKYTFNPGEGLYPRDGTDDTRRIEELVSRVTIPDQRLNIVWASGMSAVREVVNFAAVDSANSRSLVKPPVIAYARDLYSQSTAHFHNEKRKGVRVESFDSGDLDDVIETIEATGASVVFAETIANTPSMSILDIEGLLDHVRDMDNPPALVLDNTLPLSTGLDFGKLLRPDDKVIVIESGTKNLMNNSEMLGISYGANPEFTDALRKFKAHSGAVNALGSLASIASKLKLTIPGFHSRNRAVFGSTNLIGRALIGARKELLDDADFDIIFPDQADDVPTPVVFITSREWSDDATANLLSRLANHPAMREQIEAGQIYYGQSFGMERARIIYDRNAPNIRFAGGFDIEDEDSLAAAIKEAMADK